VVAEIQRITMI